MNLQSIKTTREIETAIIRVIHNSRVSDITYQYQSESFQLSFHGAPSEGSCYDLSSWANFFSDYSWSLQKLAKPVDILSVQHLSFQYQR